MPELIRCKTFITYIIAKIRKSTTYGMFDKMSRVFRRFTLAARILRYIHIAFTIIETSTVLILFAAVFLVLIPIAFAIFAVLAVLDLFIGTRILKSEELADMLMRERVYIISGVGTFGEGYARELAKGGAAVFVITPSFDKRFVCAREVGGVYYVRHAFYFRFKRKKLKDISDKTVYLI